MDQINAKLLKLEMSDWKITGTAQLVEEKSAEENYAEYIDAIGDVNFNDNVFDVFQVWVNGGGNEELLRSFPEQLSTQIQILTEALPPGLRTDRNDALESGLIDMVEQMLGWGNDINRTRAALGDGKGTIGSITGRTCF